MGILDKFKLDGKVALVTGGGQGIGRAFCLALAEAGADIAIVDIVEETAKKVAKEVEDLGRKSIVVKTNVMDRDQIDEMVLTITEKLGKLDIAVNNAGIGLPGTAEGMTRENWDRTLGIDLTGVFMCCQSEALQMMAQGTKGKIINVGSISGVVANSNIAYGVSKAGVIMLTKRMAVEWGMYGINVNAISPSWCITPMTDRVPEATKQRWKELTPMGWAETPDDLLGTLVFLASDASDYVTGQNVIVDGGHLLSVWLDKAPSK
ncbi:MAG: hypothetical protein QG670_1085 [Thermoproteota archaeon]|nr:hypothetical protein [Thermoproteota archaeon]